MTPIDIKKGRGSLGLNQTQFAELMEVRRGTVTDWESGKKIPQPKNLEKMNEFFDHTVAQTWKCLDADDLYALHKFWMTPRLGYVDLIQEVQRILMEKNI